MAAETARRVWLYGKGTWSGPLVMLGGDEYGNRPLVLRLPGERALLVNWRVPLRQHLLPSAVDVDKESDTVVVDYIFDEPIERSELVSGSLLVNYNAATDVVSVELLRPDALSRPGERKALERVLPRFVVAETVELVADAVDRSYRAGRL